MTGESQQAQLPGWYLLARAAALLVTGIAMLAHEAVGLEPGRPLILSVGLLLVGFSVKDLTGWWRR